MINGPNQIYIETQGAARARHRREVREHARRSSRRSATWRSSSASTSTSSARSSKAACPTDRASRRVLPPAAPDGPHVSIRRFFKETLTVAASHRLRRAHGRLRVRRSHAFVASEAEHPRRRRHGLGQDVDAQRALVVHPGRASASSSSKTRASSSSSAITSCSSRRGPPIAKGRGDRQHPRPLPRDAPHAPRPHRRRRDPRRRGPRPDPGHDLGSRRLPLDAPRHVPARHAHAPRDDGHDERRRDAAPGHAHPARLGREPHLFRSAVSRTARARSRTSPRCSASTSQTETYQMQDVFVRQYQGLGPKGEVLSQLVPSGDHAALPRAGSRARTGPPRVDVRCCQARSRPSHAWLKVRGTYRRGSRWKLLAAASSSCTPVRSCSRRALVASACGPSTAPGVLDVHAFMYFDGRALFLQSADPSSPAKRTAVPSARPGSRSRSPARSRSAAHASSTASSTRSKTSSMSRWTSKTRPSPPPSA